MVPAARPPFSARWRRSRVLVTDPPWPLPPISQRSTFATGPLLLYVARESSPRWRCFNTFENLEDAREAAEDWKAGEDGREAFVVAAHADLPPPFVALLSVPIERETTRVGAYERNDLVERWQEILRAAPVVWCTWSARDDEIEPNAQPEA